MKNLTAILAVLMMIFAGLACSTDETDKANAMVDEANKFITEGNKNVQDAETKGKEYNQKITASEGDEDLAKVTEYGKTELLPLYDKMKDNFQKAGEKFDAASKLKVNEKFKEYLEIKASEFKKRADYAEALKAVPKTLADGNYKEPAQKDLDKADGILKEANDLDTKAKKIQTDNPNIFKKG